MQHIMMTTAVLAALIASPVEARKASPAGDCKMVENITVGINFNNVGASSIMDAKLQFDKKAAQIAEVATELKLEKMEPHSMNYNIYAQNNNNMEKYRLNGGYQYKMTSSDTAFKFASALEQKGMNANINSSSYRRGSCD